MLLLASDHLSAAIIYEMRPDAESVGGLYSTCRPRTKTYSAMVDRTMVLLRAGLRVCMVFPGHPGVYVQPSHWAIEMARAEGFSAVMLPAISAEDRLIADLGVDPGERGCYSADATDFLVFGRRPDPSSALILWQIGVIGEVCMPDQINANGVAILAEELATTYGAAYEVIVYEAARYAVCDAVRFRTPLHDLHSAPITFRSTLYVPPAVDPIADRAMIKRLGIEAPPK